MKRDIDLIRKLLEHLESKEPDQIEVTVPTEGYSELVVKYHLLLMYEAGLLRAEATTSKTGRLIKVHPFSLTWDGHEFLDAARNDSIWNKVKSGIASSVGSVPVKVLKKPLMQGVEEAFKNGIGN